MQKIIYVKELNQKAFPELSEDCYILNSAIDEGLCQQFIKQASAKDKIVLFCGENAVKVCKNLNADGVVVDLGVDDLKEKMSALRKELGKNKYVGLFTRNRKHESMLVSETEPDFIVFKVWKDGFDNVKELTDWYQDFFLIQSAAWIMEDGIPIDKLKTDFVIL